MIRRGLIVALACLLPGAAGAQNVAEVQVAPPTVTIRVGERSGLLATAFDRIGNVIPTVRIIWSSNNVNVAKVDNNGTITGVANGVAIIEARVGARRGQAAIQVTGGATAPPAAPPPGPPAAPPPAAPPGPDPFLGQPPGSGPAVALRLEPAPPAGAVVRLTVEFLAFSPGTAELQLFARDASAAARAGRRHALRTALQEIQLRLKRTLLYHIIEVQPWSRLPERRYALIEYEP